MDAAALTPERERELADLRMRAYGPAADIDRDPTAVARLHELEQLTRSASAAGTATGTSSTDTVPGAQRIVDAAFPATNQANAVESPDDTAPVITEPGASAAVAGPHSAVATAQAQRRWWRRVPMWAYAGVAVIVAVVAVVTPALLPSPSDASLPIVDDLEPRGVEPDDMLEWFHIEPDTMKRHEDFYDIRLWSATDERGSRCLLISLGANWVDARCTPSPMEPMIDLVIYEGVPPIDGLDLAVGSVVRFWLRGDVVDVKVAAVETEAATERFDDPLQ